MKLVFYADGKAKTGDRLLQKIQEQVSAKGIETYRNFRKFEQGLLRQSLKPDVAILIAADAKELKKITTLDRLITDMRIVLVLPDRHKASVSAGHRLRARYISYVDSDFEDVVAVVRQISKLCSNAESKKRRAYRYDLKAVGHEV